MESQKSTTWFVYGYTISVPGHRRFNQICRVGYTNNLRRRHADHQRMARSMADKRICKMGRRNKRGWLFYNAIRKHGMHKFSMVILRQCETEAEALKWEDRLIAQYRTMAHDGGYNEIPGGQVSPMSSRAVVEKMKASCKSNWADPAWKRKIGKASAFCWSQPGYREAMSNKIRAGWKKPDLQNHRGILSKEMWKDAGFREKVSENMRHAWSNPDRRAQQSRRIASAWAEQPDLRQAKAVEIREKWLDPEYRAMITNARRHIYSDPEIKARHAAATKSAMADPKLRLRIRLGRVRGAIARQTLKFQDAKARGRHEIAKRCRRELKRLRLRLKELKSSRSSFR